MKTEWLQMYLDLNFYFFSVLAGDKNQCCDRSCETSTAKTCGDGSSCVEVTT